MITGKWRFQTNIFGKVVLQVQVVKHWPVTAYRWKKATLQDLFAHKELRELLEKGLEHVDL